MTFVGLFLLGLVLAAVFDWMIACGMNLYRLQTAKEKRQAMLAAFAFHGPALSLAFPLFLGGMIEGWLVNLGMKAALAWFACLPIMAAIIAVAIWLMGLLPAVRRAKAATRDSMATARSDWNRRFGRLLGYGSLEKSS